MQEQFKAMRPLRSAVASDGVIVIPPGKLVSTGKLASLTHGEQQKVLNKEFFVRSYVQAKRRYDEDCCQARRDVVRPPSVVFRTSTKRSRVG